MDFLIGEINKFLDGVQEYNPANKQRIDQYLKEVIRHNWHRPFSFLPKMGPLDEEDWDAPRQLKLLIYRARLKKYTYRRLRVALQSHYLYERGYSFKEALPLGGEYAVKSLEGGIYSHYVYSLLLNFFKRTPVKFKREYLIKPEEARMLGKRVSPLVKDTARRIALAAGIAAASYRAVRAEMGLGTGAVREYNKLLQSKGILPDVEPAALRQIGIDIPTDVRPRSGEWYRQLEKRTTEFLKELDMAERFKTFLRDARWVPKH